MKSSESQRFFLFLKDDLHSCPSRILDIKKKKSEKNRNTSFPDFFPQYIIDYRGHCDMYIIVKHMWEEKPVAETAGKKGKKPGNGSDKDSQEAHCRPNRS